MFEADEDNEFVTGMLGSVGLEVKLQGNVDVICSACGLCNWETNSVGPGNRRLEECSRQGTTGY